MSLVQPLGFGTFISPDVDINDTYTFSVNEVNFYGTGNAPIGFDSNFATIDGFDAFYNDKVDLFFEEGLDYIDYTYLDYVYSSTIDANHNGIPDTGIYLPGGQDLIAVVLDNTGADFIPSSDII